MATPKTWECHDRLDFDDMNEELMYVQYLDLTRKGKAVPSCQYHCQLRYPRHQRNQHRLTKAASNESWRRDPGAW